MQSLWMIFASLCFACMGVCVKLGAAYFSAAEIVFYRSVISLVLVGGFIAWTGRAVRTPHWRRQLFRGGSGFVSLLLYFYAIALLPLATAVTLNYTSPLFLALYLVCFARVRLQWMLLVAIAIGFAGVVLLLQPTLRSDQWLAGLIGLGSGVGAGLAYFNVRQLGELGEPEWRTVFYFSLLCTLGSLVWVLALNGLRFSPITLEGGLLMLGVGGFATLAQLTMTRAYRLGKTMVSASLAYSTVVFASLFGILLWHEVLSPAGWFGMVLVMAAGLLSTGHTRLGARLPGRLATRAG